MIHGLLLAAGFSSRFGGNKLLHPLPGGRTVAEQAAYNLLLAVPASTAVIQPGDALLRERFEHIGLRVVECANAVRGMGASLSCGVAATAAADGWIVALADMPWIRSSTIHAIAGRIAGGAAIAAPWYHAQRGHPVGFSAVFYEQLCGLDGDVGARDIVAAHRARIEKIVVDDGGIIADIDHPAEVAAPNVR